MAGRPITAERLAEIQQLQIQFAERKRAHRCRFSVALDFLGRSIIRCTTRRSHRIVIEGRADRADLVEAFEARGLMAEKRSCECSCGVIVYAPQRFIRGHNLRVIVWRKRAAPFVPTDVAR
ncbi:MAG: hypothetical protein L0206_01035 [Actinobacteria bacterium]|nr:hypothetical protein [Actinomycetota bacterium]